MKMDTLPFVILRTLFFFFSLLIGGEYVGGAHEALQLQVSSKSFPEPSAGLIIEMLIQRK